MLKYYVVLIFLFLLISYNTNAEEITYNFNPPQINYNMFEQEKNRGEIKLSKTPLSELPLDTKIAIIKNEKDCSNGQCSTNIKTNQVNKSITTKNYFNRFWFFRRR